MEVRPTVKLYKTRRFYSEYFHLSALRYQCIDVINIICLVNLAMSRFYSRQCQDFIYLFIYIGNRQLTWCNSYIDLLTSSEVYEQVLKMTSTIQYNKLNYKNCMLCDEKSNEYGNNNYMKRAVMSCIV